MTQEDDGAGNMARPDGARGAGPALAAEGGGPLAVRDLAEQFDYERLRLLIEGKTDG